ncbi:MAG: hypothetical protein ACI8PT_003924, partial [Gammaproteobacteria bacterium]
RTVRFASLRFASLRFASLRQRIERMGRHALWSGMLGQLRPGRWELCALLSSALRNLVDSVIRMPWHVDKCRVARVTRGSARTLCVVLD